MNDREILQQIEEETGFICSLKGEKVTALYHPLSKTYEVCVHFSIENARKNLKLVIKNLQEVAQE